MIIIHVLRLLRVSREDVLHDLLAWRDARLDRAESAAGRLVRLLSASSDGLAAQVRRGLAVQIL
jgi:hypothetical protein